MEEKKLWILLKNNISDSPDNADTQLKSLAIPVETEKKQIKKFLLEAFNLPSSGIVVKFRNHNNALIPINHEIPLNAPSRPYTLEVCNIYQTVKPTPRTVSVATYEQVLKRKMQSILARLDTLEESVPQLPQICQNKLEKEFGDITEVMNFLDNKIKKADECQWQGMFEKNPLW